MSNFLNSKFQKLDAYVPGEQPRVKMIKLNTNESPYPAGPKTVEAVCNPERAANLRLYCDPDAMALKKAIANRYGVEVSNVFTANGSDDILNLAFMGFAESGVLFPEISYGFYQVFADLHGIDCIKVPLKDDWSIDSEDYMDKGKMIVIANPNAPTGRQISQDDIGSICKSNPNNVVLIDEAYVDFGGTSAAPMTKQYDNLLVVQTFSKSRSLAGARLGFSIASEKITSDLERIKFSTNPYNVNTISAAAGVAALEEADYYEGNCKKIIETREYSVERMTRLGFEIVPSVANFIFVKHNEFDGKELYLKLKERNILIRHFDNPKIEKYNRITIGTMEEMDALFAAIEEIINK